MLTHAVVRSQSPAGRQVDFDRLAEFERGLDTRAPERSRIPCRVLGYGEISTVLEIPGPEFEGLALKRLAIFHSSAELERYCDAYVRGCQLLEAEVGLSLPAHGYALLAGARGRPVFYIVQARLPAPWFGNQVLHSLPAEAAPALLTRVLQELRKVWLFNQRRHPTVAVGLDGQLSNWAVTGFAPEQPAVPEQAPLLYLDTSTPLFRLDGVEQLDVELFLRNAPAPLAAVLRRFFLKDVVDRYYDLHRVTVDLIANLYKEQCDALVPGLVAAANRFFETELASLAVKPITTPEVRSYYQEDAFIWTFYLAARRLDRAIQTRLLRRDYAYILPGHIKR